MKNKESFNNFLYNGVFEDVLIEELKETTCLNDKKLIRDSFLYLRDLINKYENNDYYNIMIYNTICFISVICEKQDFDDEEILVNRKRIKKYRELILKLSNIYSETSLLYAANVLDTITLERSINSDELKILIIELINRKESVDIIKKLLNTNKDVLSTDDNQLFDYTFNKSLDSIANNTPDIYYYITLLKILYSSTIDKRYYINKLNSVSDDTNEFANEIYRLILGNKRSLKPEEVLNKYGFITKAVNIFVPKLNQSNYSDFVLTIDDKSAKIRDDALSIKKDGNKYIIDIFITDPSLYIDIDSEVDIQMKNNYKSVGLLNILPYNTIKNFSLDAKTFRNTITLHIIVNNNGCVEDYKLDKNVINIGANLSFNEADLLLNNLNNELSLVLAKLYEVSCLLEARNPQKKEYWKNKSNNKIDNDREKHNSDIIVNENMVLYNHLIALLMKENNIPYIYRIQNYSYLEDLVKEMNIKLDKQTRDFIKTIYLTSSFSTEPRYHSGLNLNPYSQSTNPLQKYTAFYNQQLVHHFYFKDKPMDFDPYVFQELVCYLNQRETEIKLMRSEYARALKMHKKN